MSRFGDDFEDGCAPAMLFQLGDTITLTAPGESSGSSVTAIFERLLGVRGDLVFNGVFKVATSVTVTRGYVITFQSQPWTVLDVADNEDGMLEVYCIGPETIT